MSSPFIGTGTTITFATSSFTAKIMDITPPGASRESIQTSYMGSLTSHTFIPAKLVDWGELSFDILFDPGASVPISGVTELITITFSDSGAATWVFNGFVTGYEPTVPLEDLASATITVKVTGKVTITA